MARDPMKNVGSYLLTAEMLAVCVGPNVEETNSSSTTSPAVEPKPKDKKQMKKPGYVNHSRMGRR